MKLNPEQLKLILNQHQIHFTEAETKAVLPLLGLTAKEYYYNAAKVDQDSNRHFEVHHRRNYLFKVDIDNSRSVSFNNQYINFSEGCHGIAFGGIDTVKGLLHLILITANKIDNSYDGQVIFNPDESDYTEEEFRTLVETINELIFQS